MIPSRLIHVLDLGIAPRVSYFILFLVYFISIKPVLSDHLPYVAIFHCSLGRSHKTGLTVLKIFVISVVEACKGNISYENT
jgi:hypothetical protein